MAQVAVAVGGSGNSLLAASTGFLAFLYVGVCAGAGRYPLRRALWLLPVGLSGLAGPALPGATTLRDLITLLAVAAAWSTAAYLAASLVRTLENRCRQIHQLERLADADPLTGLRNRRALTRDLHAAGSTGAIAILDLDDFKQFNDAHGHLAGDAVLATFAAFLESSVRRTDLAYRFGGEEFVLLLADTTLDAATTQVEQLALGWQRFDGRVTFSAGIATVTDHLRCLEAADANLYLAKRAGRNLVIAEPPQPAVPVATARETSP